MFVHVLYRCGARGLSTIHVAHVAALFDVVQRVDTSFEVAFWHLVLQCVNEDASVIVHNLVCIIAHLHLGCQLFVYAS